MENELEPTHLRSIGWVFAKSADMDGGILPMGHNDPDKNRINAARMDELWPIIRDAVQAAIVLWGGVPPIDADDLAGTIALRVWESIRANRGDWNSWPEDRVRKTAIAAARNLLVDEHRRRALAAKPSLRDHARVREAPAEPAESITRRREKAMLAERLIAELDPSSREILTSRLRGDSLSEIADRIGVAVSTVSRRYRSVLESLLKNLEA